MPRTGALPMIGDSPMTGAGVARSASRIPGTPRMVPIETTGLLGPTSTTSASAIASTTPGAGFASSMPIWTNARVGMAARYLDPPLLEVDRLALAVELDDHVRLAPLVGHRQQADPGLPALAQGRGDVGERVAGVDHLGADEVGGDVEITEPEPGRFDAVDRELVLDPPGLAGPSPAPVGVDAAAEGVHHAVEIRADPQPVHDDVVAGIHDRGDLGVGVAGPHATQEPGAADAAGEDCDPHRSNLRDQR